MAEPRILVWLLIEQEDAILLGRRKADTAPFAGRWVLPGDEMGEDESASETTERFAREQLDLRVRGEEFVETLYLSDGGKDFAVNVFRVGYEGRPRFRESGPYQEVRWFLRSDLDRLQGVVESLRQVVAGDPGGRTR